MSNQFAPFGSRNAGIGLGAYPSSNSLHSSAAPRCEEESAQRLNHHVALDSEIDALGGCVELLDDLISRVRSGPVGEINSQCVPRPVRSLSDVLEGGADRISSARQLICERVRSLDELLF